MPRDRSESPEKSASESFKREKSKKSKRRRTRSRSRDEKGGEDTGQETIDIEGEGIPQVHHPAVQIQILHTDLISKGRRVRLKD